LKQKRRPTSIIVSYQKTKQSNLFWGPLFRGAWASEESKGASCAAYVFCLEPVC